MLKVALDGCDILRKVDILEHAAQAQPVSIGVAFAGLGIQVHAENGVVCGKIQQFPQVRF